MAARYSRSATTSRRISVDGREAGRKAIAILRALPDAVLLYNSNGIVEDANPAAENLFGRSATSLVGSRLEDLVVPSNLNETFADTCIAGSSALGRAIIEKGEGLAIRSGKTSVPVEVSFRPVNVEGRPYGTAICRDTADRRRLEYDVLHVSDEERARISHDLHDGLGSLLTGASFALHAVAGSIRKGNIPDIARIDKIAELVDEGATIAQDIARGLSPLDGSATLEEGIGKVVGRSLALSGVRIEADVGPVMREPVPRVAAQLYRIAQEALQNAVKHAEASMIRVVLRGTGEHVVLEVRDDGIGLPRGRESDLRNGIGMRLMRYRAHLIGASLSIEPGESGGTRLECVYPFPGAASNQSEDGGDET